MRRDAASVRAESSPPAIGDAFMELSHWDVARESPVEE
jgi:hypothetical protein